MTRNGRIAAVFLLLGTGKAAWANGAMGLGLEMFDFQTWLVYVAATVVLEAWMLGRWMEMSWPKSLLISATANLITGLCCTQMAAPFLHQAIVGPRVNPSPLGNAIGLFAIFGLVSAFLETIVWLAVRPKHGDGAWPDNRVLLRTVTTHAVGIPLALAILLVPPRPYVGLEAFTSSARRQLLDDVLNHSFGDTVKRRGRIPTIGSVEELLRRYPPSERRKGHAGNAWAAGYAPDFARFDLGEACRAPLEWNPTASGRRLAPDAVPEEDGHPLWLIRGRHRDRVYGWAIDLQTGKIGQTRNPIILGFEQEP